MRRGLLWIFIALLAGTVAFFFMRWQQSSRVNHLASHGMPGLLWLRDELKLNEAQYAKVQALHTAYMPQCQKLCERIEDSHKRLSGLFGKSTKLSPELELALKEHSDVHLECQQAMLGHLYATAAAMDGPQGRRYLDLVLPSAVSPSHHESGCPLCGAHANPTGNGNE